MGGGQFGTIGGTPRTPLVLGEFGGLAAANRGAENTQEKNVNLVTEQQARAVGIQANNPGWTNANAAASQKPGGYARVSGLGQFDPNFAVEVTSYDDSGQGKTTYRPGVP